MHFKQSFARLSMAFQEQPIYWMTSLLACRTMTEHYERLRRVLDRLQTAKVVINADKIIFGQAEVNFNGHQIRQNGVLP